METKEKDNERPVLGSVIGITSECIPLDIYQGLVSNGWVVTKGVPRGGELSRELLDNHLTVVFNSEAYMKARGSYLRIAEVVAKYFFRVGRESSDTIGKLAAEIHSDACNKGFYDNQREVGTLLMLVVSELSEALEADRAGRHAPNPAVMSGDSEDFATRVKDTFEDEIADAIIRLLDLCGYFGIDIDWHVRAKMEYNRERPIRHGKRY